jgi:DNA polymerase I
LAKPKTDEAKQAVADEVLAWCKSAWKSHTRIETEYYKGEVIRTQLQLKRLQKKLMRVDEFAFDTEFTSLRMQYKGESDFVGCSFSWGKYNNYYVPVGHVLDDEEEQVSLKLFVKYMKKVFSRTDVRVIGHNLKAELHTLANIGIHVATNDLFDTLIAVWNLDENNEVGLKEVTKRYYNYNQRHFEDLLYTISKQDKKEWEIKGKGDVSFVKIFVGAPYALDDTYWTWRIYCDIQDSMEEDGCESIFYKRQMPYLRVLFNMERRGVKVDFKRLKEMGRLAEKELEKLEYEIFEIAGLEFNIGSGDQLAEILFGYDKQKPIYEIIHEPILENGKPVYYKSGKRKGEQKFKEIKNKDKIIGYESSGNKHLIENSFGFKPIKKTDSGVPATGKEALEPLAQKVYKRDKRKAEGVRMVTLILRYKRLMKLKSTYMEGLSKEVYSDGRIHCSFNQTGTTSGRLSCSSPNLQNLPRSLEDVYEPVKEKYPSEADYQKAYDAYTVMKDDFDFWKRFEIRDAFIPDSDDECIIACDYSNLEMRILTHFSQDPLLLSMFSREADAHGDTAVNMFKLDCSPDEAKKLYPHLRQQAKTINFLLVYGGSAIALSSQLGIDKKEAQELYDIYFDTYDGVAGYLVTQKKYGHKYEIVQTILGRKRHLEGINSQDWSTKGYFERLAVNSPVQGSAADIAISAQILLENDEELKRLGYKQLIQVHDEVVGSCPKKNKEKVAKRKKYLMENCLPKPLNGVKLRVDYDFGDSYAQAK